MFKTVIFDFDGTLADSLAAIVIVVGQLAKQFKQEKLLKTPIGELRDKTVLELIKQFKIPFYRLPFLLNQGRRLLVNEVSRIKIFPGIEQTLKQLRLKNINIGVLSSNSEKNIKKVFEDKGIKKFFEFIHSEFNLFGKDKALLHIIKQYHLDKNQTIYIGDEVRDIEACKKIGLKVIAVSWGFNSRKILKKYQPDFIVGRPGEISKIILYE